MTPATSKSTNLDVVVGDRGERKAVYGYVYGEERKIRTSASSRRLKSGAAHAARSAERYLMSFARGWFNIGNDRNGRR
jgi:hypothetical protein